MKKILFMEAALAGLLLLLFITVIQMSSCGKNERSVSVDVRKTQPETSKKLWIYAGNISEKASPLKQGAESEQNIWGLCFSNIFLDAAEKKDFKKEGRTKAFFYDVEKKKNITITIGVHSALKTAFGTSVTADDLLFNYYLRCDPSLASGDSFAAGIEGGKEYFYGTGQVGKRKKQISALIKKPGKWLKEEIASKIILPELSLEYAWVEKIFSKDNSMDMRKGYKSPEEFFAHFYAYHTSYQSNGKTKEEILKEIAGQYGSNYQALEKVTGRSYKDRVEGYALTWLLEQEKTDTVKSIRGIQKIDEHTIKLTLSRDDIEIQTYLDFWLLPLENYSADGFEKTSFVWKKGKADAVCEKAEKSYIGSGAYYCGAVGKTKLTFYKNIYDLNFKKEVGRIDMFCNCSFTVREIVEKMLEKKIDIAVFPYSEETEKLIKEKKTGAIEKLAYFFPEEETDVGILYRTDYINATTFPLDPGSLRRVFCELGNLQINES